jgi:hypothetical protein
MQYLSVSTTVSKEYLSVPAEVPLAATNISSIPALF